MALSNATVSKNVFIGIITVLVLAVLGEFAWGAMTLSQKTSSAPSQPTTMAVSTPTPVATPKTAAMLIKADKTDLKVGDTITFTISVSSTAMVDGVDAIINFDPKILALDKTSTTSATLKVGTLLDSYPANKIDDKKGRIELSGISSGTQGKKIDGILATFTLKAKAKGISKVDFDFSPGSTTDSNIIETKTGEDVLQIVKGAEVEVK